VEQFRKFLENVPEPFRTVCIVAMCLGLRVGEILGLRSKDIDREGLRPTGTTSLCLRNTIKLSQRGSPQLIQNCTKTLCYCGLGAYFERETDSPKLLETLGSEVKEWNGMEWNRWSAGSCA